MSLDPPAYILSLQNNIRARPISWEGAVRAKTITEQDLKKIKSIDKVRKEQRRQTVESDPESYAALVLGSDDSASIFQSAAKRSDIVQYMLVLTGDLIEVRKLLTGQADIPSFVAKLLDHADPYAPFVPLLKQTANPEDPIPLLASCVLSALISHGLMKGGPQAEQIDKALPKLYSYISTLAKKSDNNLQDIAVQEYSALLRTAKSRQLFWEQRKDTVTPLFDILTNATGGAVRDTDSTLISGGSIRSIADSQIINNVGLQLLYHVLLVIWQLSFEGELVGRGLDEEHDIIVLYAALLRISPKEKTTRLLLATLTNLLSTNRDTLMPAVIPARLPAILQNLQGRHLNDADLLEDLKALQSMVEEFQKTQTTFSEYAAEVNSGHLRWSPPHRNQAFWSENARKILEDNKGELAKKLAEILSKSWENDKQVLAIGCNDVACLVKEVPEKRQQMERLGLKSRVMELMQHSDESVRWESLRAVGEWLRYSFEK
ncbi:vacuolar ATP synthase-like protein subunit H [Aureobasidium pullulans]|uniref:V-type proton ATPase subunit H n=1 Tax=Aureobasidium pullulans TaxID=5580 RepID=A0A4S9CDK9_AURPU|nr:vacuolar ATP synthase-like protein subunit H [Aureobasidium pullulans]